MKSIDKRDKIRHPITKNPISTTISFAITFFSIPLSEKERVLLTIDQIFPGVYLLSSASVHKSDDSLYEISCPFCLRKYCHRYVLRIQKIRKEHIPIRSNGIAGVLKKKVTCEVCEKINLNIKNKDIKDRGHPMRNLKKEKYLLFIQKDIFFARLKGIEPPTPSSEAKCSIR